MASPPALDLRRLAQFLGMMGSEHDGEALNAARLAHRLVKEAKLTWPEVFKLPPPEPERPGWAGARPNGSGPQPGSKEWWDMHNPPPPPPPPPNNREWMDDVEACLENPESLNQWEIDFLDGLDRFQYLSAKQQAVLDKIKAKVSRYSGMSF